MAVVVSAMGGVTNQLIEASELALDGDQAYLELLDKIEFRHLETAEQLLDGDLQIKARTMVVRKIAELGKILQGIALLNDLSDKTSARILSMGE